MDKYWNKERLEAHAAPHLEFNPEKKPWVGLTDDEIKDIVGRNDPGGIGSYTRDLFKKIEDKLKEKNT